MVLSKEKKVSKATEKFLNILKFLVFKFFEVENFELRAVYLNYSYYSLPHLIIRLSIRIH